MKFDILDPRGIDFEALDSLLLDGDRLRCMPAAVLQTIPTDHLRAWAARCAIYNFPTWELVEWLKEKIAGRTALEIGAGNASLGFYLKIPMTDSYQQIDNPMVRLYFLSLGQKPTTPPPNVIKEDAETAVRTRKPQVVIGSWITQKWKTGDANGNEFGPREEYILERCQTYIHIGNEGVHNDKRIMAQPHETFSFPWLVSRSKKPELNRIWVWNRK